MAKLIYEGKAKQMWSTDDPEVLRVVYMDQATALNGKKKDQINGKGIVNNEISSLIFQYLMKKGIETHFIKKLSETEELVKKLRSFRSKWLRETCLRVILLHASGLRKASVLKRLLKRHITRATN